jgi:hypothetical protein
MSWAEAVAEALALAPASIADLAADAQSGAPWRKELRLREPSSLLRQSIDGTFQIAQAVGASGGKARVDAALLASEQSRPGESALDGLARSVLRSALRQRQARP